jgi:glycosyltransferase involved in cell wall biosynthesis
MRSPSAAPPAVSVVLPAFNEEAAVGATVAAIAEALRGASVPAWEILVVDDGSTDGTRAAAEQAGARVVSHPYTAGYGRSLKDGILAAAHETIVICDADGTYPAGAIPGLLAAYGRGFDMVVGRRGSFQDAPGKMLMRRILKWLVEYATGTRVPDINSGLRVFERAAVTPLFRTLCNTFSFSTSLTLAFLMTGRFIGYVPIDYGQRTGRTKVRLFRDALRTLQYILEALAYYNPLKVFLLVAALFAAGAAVAFGLWLADDRLAAFVGGWFALALALLSFFFGLLASRLRLARED